MGLVSGAVGLIQMLGSRLGGNRADQISGGADMGLVGLIKSKWD